MGSWSLTMHTSDEKLCLKWNDFQENVTSAFGERRQDREFADVTLACDDGQQVEAHKVILASSSPFFLDILKRNKHPHPLIYMRGLKSEDLMALVDFLYFGEANVYQENLDSFLAIADELKLKGLTENQTIDEETTPLPVPKQKLKTKKEPLFQYSENEASPTTFTKLDEPNANKEDAGAVAVTDLTVAADLQGLDEQINSMMELGGAITVGNLKKIARVCTVCGKEGYITDIKRHIEAAHITGVSHNCNICGKTSRSRHALRAHISRDHKEFQ